VHVALIIPFGIRAVQGCAQPHPAQVALAMIVGPSGIVSAVLGSSWRGRVSAWRRYGR
jgi:hypothetical protein